MLAFMSSAAAQLTLFSFLQRAFAPASRSANEDAVCLFVCVPAGIARLDVLVPPKSDRHHGYQDGYDHRNIADHWCSDWILPRMVRKSFMNCFACALSGGVPCHL